MMSAPATLEVLDLRTHFFTKDGVVKAVDGVSFAVNQGKVLGLVGESGSGKTVTGFSVLGLVEPPGRIVGGKVLFHGNDVVALSDDKRRQLRGSKIAMIFQDSMMTLNPVLRIDTQMIEAIQAHDPVHRAIARQRARDALGKVGISSADQRLKAYPHQFSGGMRQRVAIAIALLNKPDLIIADEPTTALDATIQAQILHEAQKLCRETGTALIWITHDLAVVAGLADRICVMYAGRIVEEGGLDEVLDDPLHPYTKGLIEFERPADLKWPERCVALLPSTSRPGDTSIAVERARRGPTRFDHELRPAADRTSARPAGCSRPSDPARSRASVRSRAGLPGAAGGAGSAGARRAAAVRSRTRAARAPRV